MGSNHEKNGGQKPCDTLPLSGNTGLEPEPELEPEPK